MQEIKKILKSISVGKEKRHQELEKILKEIEDNKKLTSTQAKFNLFNKCIAKTVHSVIFQYSSADELEEYRNCLRKEIAADMYVIGYYQRLRNPSFRDTIQKFADV